MSLHSTIWVARDAYSARVTFDHKPTKDEVQKSCSHLTGTVDVYEVDVEETRERFRFDVNPTEEKTRAALVELRERFAALGGELRRADLGVEGAMSTQISRNIEDHIRKLEENQS